MVLEGGIHSSEEHKWNTYFLSLVKHTHQIPPTVQLQSQNYRLFLLDNMSAGHSIVTCDIMPKSVKVLGVDFIVFIESETIIHFPFTKLQKNSMKRNFHQII